MLRPDDGIVNEWFPVATISAVQPGSRHPFALLDDRFVLLADDAGEVLAVRDTCPHRGAQLSLGTWNGVTLACPYHGWEFDGTGRCTRQPAQPTLDPPHIADLRPIAVQRAHGLYWICVGDAPRTVPLFPDYQRWPGQSVIFGPKVLASSGPRIVENFLDMAHFPYVHADYLGQVPHTEVRPYAVAVVDGELQATNCVFSSVVIDPAME